MQSTRVQFPLKISWEIFKWSISCFKVGRELQRKSSRTNAQLQSCQSKQVGLMLHLKTAQEYVDSSKPQWRNRESRTIDAWECRCFEKQVESRKSAAAAASHRWPWWDAQPAALLVISAKGAPTSYRLQVEVNRQTKWSGEKKTTWPRRLLKHQRSKIAARDFVCNLEIETVYILNMREKKPKEGVSLPSGMLLQVYQRQVGEGNWQMCERRGKENKDWCSGTLRVCIQMWDISGWPVVPKKTSQKMFL